MPERVRQRDLPKDVTCSYTLSPAWSFLRLGFCPGANTPLCCWCPSSGPGAAPSHTVAVGTVGSAGSISFPPRTPLSSPEHGQTAVLPRFYMGRSGMSSQNEPQCLLKNVSGYLEIQHKKASPTKRVLNAAQCKGEIKNRQSFSLQRNKG